MKTTSQILILIAFFCFTMFTQSFGQKEQIAFLPGVFQIEESLRKEKSILENYSDGFDTAILLYDKESGKYFLRVSYSKRKNNWEEEYNFSDQQLADIREKLSMGKQATQDGARNQTNEGRFYLISSVTLHSIPQSIIFSNVFRREYTVTDPWGTYTYTEKSKLGRAFPLLLSAGAFTSSLFLTRDKNISSAMANMHFFSSLNGYTQGLLLGGLIYGEDNFDFDNNMTYAILSGTSIAAGWIGYGLAKRHKIDYARSMAWNTGNFWGLSAGALTYLITAGEESGSLRGFSLTGLLGTAGGIALYNTIHKIHPRSSGDYRAINSLGMIGSIWGSAFAFNMDDVRPVGISLLLSSAAGLAIGHSSTKDTDLTKLEGGLVVLGSFVGGLFGGGLSILLEPDSFQVPVYLTAAGATGGWLATFLYFKNADKALGKMGSTNRRSPKFQMSLNPTGIGLVTATPERQASLLQRNIRMDMVNCSLTF